VQNKRENFKQKNSSLDGDMPEEKKRRKKSKQKRTTEKEPDTVQTDPVTVMFFNS